MARNNVAVLAALATGITVGLAAAVAPAPAVAQKLQKYVTPDGKTVYSDRPIPGARLVDEIAAPPPVDPKAAAEAQNRARDDARKAQASDATRAEGDKAAQQQNDAAAALARAKEQLEKGKEPLPGERIGTASGNSRLTDAYWERQRANEQAVKDAEARLAGHH
jgi:Domain of unknown function (DUF4124)